MPELPNQPTLADYQTYVQAMCELRGWDKRTALEKMLFLTEEVGEVAKEIRKQAGQYGYATPENTDELAGELIDVFNYLLDIATMHDIDLETAFRKNWQKNATRVWATPK